MRWPKVKKLLAAVVKGLGLLFAVLLLAVAGSFWWDAHRLNYLYIDHSAASDAQGGASCLITHVAIVPMSSDTVWENKTVYVKNGRIERIADALFVPDVVEIDGTGKYLMPGLIDMHVHVWDRYELGLYLANGVTAVRNVWGMPQHLRIKSDQANDRLLAPSFFTTGPKLTGPEFIGADNLNLYTPEEARRRVASYQARGYDFIKTYRSSLASCCSKSAACPCLKILPTHVGAMIPLTKNTKLVRRLWSPTSAKPI